MTCKNGIALASPGRGVTNAYTMVGAKIVNLLGIDEQEELLADEFHGLQVC